MVTFVPGWLPTPAHVSRPRFDAALRDSYAPPASVDYSQVPVVGMHLNDQLGCCTCASDANIIQGITYYGLGSETVVPDAVVLQAYEQSGYNPNAGPSTDQGWLISDALALLKSTGMCGHSIAAYGQLNDGGNHVKVQTCIAEFGYLSIGINMPQAAMDQFNAGQPWDTGGDTAGIGGHCVCVCGYNPAGPVCWTWGRAQQMTWAFWDAYVDEVWPVVSADWVSAASGKDPEGVDLVTLGQEFLAAVGQNPFPAPAPPAPPAPAPAPPAPVPSPPAPPAPTPGCAGLARPLNAMLRWRYYTD